MRRIINSTYISADGVIEKPHLWPSSGSSCGASDKIQTDLLLSCDALIMGRRTYESFAPCGRPAPATPSDHIKQNRRFRRFAPFSRLASVEDPGSTTVTEEL